MQLRPYQESSINKLRESIARGNKKILLSAATGAGKSIIIKTIIKNALDKNSNAKILYIVHRNILISQMKETLKEFNIEISTLQKAGRKETIEYDLVLSDESHYGHGSKLFNNIKYKYFLGFTATPICSNGYVLDGYDDIIKIAELIDLVELGYMPPLKTVGLPVIDTNRIKIRNGDFDIKQSFDALNKSVVYENIYDAFIKYAKDMKTLIYCVNVEHSEKVKNDFLKNGISCDSYHSKKTKKERERIFNDFKSGKLQVLTNCDTLTTGVDLTDIYCLMMAAPTKSYIKAIQIYGRIRLNPLDKEKVGLIIDLAEVIKNTCHPLERLDLNKTKDQKGHKCKKCNDIMILTDRKTEEINQYEYIVISDYKCNCGHFEQVQTPKVVNFELCENCGNRFENEKMVIDDNKNLTFNLTCKHCGHKKVFREILYTKKELEEITLENAKNGSTWDDVKVLLKKACKDNGYHWKYSERLLDRLKNKKIHPDRAIREIAEIMKRKQKISKLMYIDF